MGESCGQVSGVDRLVAHRLGVGVWVMELRPGWWRSQSGGCGGVLEVVLSVVVW